MYYIPITIPVRLRLAALAASRASRDAYNIGCHPLRLPRVYVGTWCRALLTMRRLP